MKLEKTINDQMENIKLLEIKLQIAESKGKTTEEILSILDNPEEEKMKTESLKLAPREEIKEKVKEIQQKQVYLQFAKNGTCKLGQNCPIKHDDMLEVETGNCNSKRNLENT